MSEIVIFKITFSLQIVIFITLYIVHFRQLAHNLPRDCPQPAFQLMPTYYSYWYLINILQTLYLDGI